MQIDNIINVINQAMVETKRKDDYSRLLLFFLEKAIIENKYGKPASYKEFVSQRKEFAKNLKCCLETPLFTNPQNYPKDVFQCFEKYEEIIDLCDIGLIFEDLYNREIDSDSGVLIDGSGRKDSGMFFSDRTLVRYIIKSIIRYDSDINKTFLDPSMGAGVFLAEIINHVSKKNKKVEHFIENSIYGVDKNPVVVDIFKSILWIKYPSIDLKKLSKHIRSFDSLLTPIYGGNDSWNGYFSEVFSEHQGFDYVVGNPPWGRIKANIREYNLFYNTLARNFQGDRLKNAVAERSFAEGWNNYKNDINAYSQKLKEHINYSNQVYLVNEEKTGGDADLYKYFLELSFKLLNASGKLGFIIPASFYMNEGSTGLRHLFLENGTIKNLYGFENKKHIFPIHPSYKFLIMIYEKGQRGFIEKAKFNLQNPEDLFNISDTVRYTIKDLNTCSGDYWSVPECRSSKELKLFRKLYRLYKKNPSWKVGFSRELDMTLDSQLFVLGDERKNKEIYFPLYEGRMVTQYNCRSKEYISGNGRTAIWKKIENGKKQKIKSHYYVKADDVTNKGIKTGYRAAYCDVTGQKNVRTVLATLIPSNTVCGNKVPTCTFEPNDDICFHLLWIGAANSFVVDWMIRKKISITLNFFHWDQIPFPWMDVKSESAVQICAAVAKLLNNRNGFDLYDVLPDESKEYYLRYDSLHNDDLRIMIDVLIADYYRLNVYELAMILYDFQALDQNEKGIIGDTRYDTKRKASYVTRDKVLYEYITSHLLDDDDIIELYKKAGFFIEKHTAEEYHSLKKRVAFYKKEGIMAYTD